MKLDLFSSIGLAIIGVILAFFVCNIFIGPIEDFSFKVINSNTTTTLSQPNVEIFNYKAINPTVEVYVGSCDEYNVNGECLSYSTANDSNRDTNNGANE